MAITLQINGDGMSVNKEVSLTQAGKILAFLGSETEASEYGSALVQAPSAVLPVDTFSTGATSRDARQSLREKMATANAKTHAHRITVLGHYAAEMNPDGEFTVTDIKALYPQAREKMPPNFSRELDAAITAGYIEGVHGKKDTYYITNTGEDSIATGFAPLTRKPRSNTKTSNGKTKAITVESVSEAVAALHPITPELDGHVNYHSLQTKGLKILWILAYAQAHSIDKLSPKEIAFIASKLRDKIEPRDMNGLTVTASKSSWIAKDNEANYSLLYKGEQHLKSLAAEDGTS